MGQHNIVTYLFLLVSCVDLVKIGPAVEHKPLMAFIEAVTSSHQFIANESPSGIKSLIQCVVIQVNKLGSKSANVF